MCLLLSHLNSLKNVRLISSTKNLLRIQSTETKWRRNIIKEMTEITDTFLVPDVKLRLITPNCPLWTSPPELCPVSDPYWAFFWPGGQVLCRYLLDNPAIVKNQRVLDIGSGCGASAIVALKSGAEVVIANDIDEIALTAIVLNLELNSLSDMEDSLFLSNTDILSAYDGNEWNGAASEEPLMLKSLKDIFLLSKYSSNSMKKMTKNYVHNPYFNTVLVGDLFYDESIISRVYNFLITLKMFHPDTVILIGDPGRCFIRDHKIAKNLKVVEQYDLPDDNIDHGLSVGAVYEFEL